MCFTSLPVGSSSGQNSSSGYGESFFSNKICIHTNALRLNEHKSMHSAVFLEKNIKVNTHEKRLNVQVLMESHLLITKKN